ncbi:MAG TPA: ECF-type sigma factor [Gemmataceae bacterium]|nr:ECF-type sigma factor [Gemmataceae bacterium]
MAASDSFTAFRDSLRARDNSAAAQFLHDFAGRLLAIAREQLPANIRRKVDPEDVLQSALRSFFTHYLAGEFEIDNWESLWGILALITLRKSQRHVTYFHAARRDVRREESLQSNHEEAAQGPGAAAQPTPEEVAIATETLRQLKQVLEKRGRHILDLYLAGHTVPEIRDEVRCSERTVHRTIYRLRQTLRGLLAEADDVP